MCIIMELTPDVLYKTT